MKPITLEEALARLDPERRAEIESGAAVIIREIDNLRAVRESVAQSQAQVAARLGIEQSAVSRLERRADMYISTLRNLIKAMGGELDIVARFPGKEPVRIVQFRDTEARPARKRGKKVGKGDMQQTP